LQRRQAFPFRARESFLARLLHQPGQFLLRCGREKSAEAALEFGGRALGADQGLFSE
jgi:hypothetical protein